MTSFDHSVCHNDVAIGAVCCRIEVDAESSQKKLYIMTLGVLAPYREYGVGADFFMSPLA